MNVKDKVINYKGSIIQHGKYNDRIYLIKLDPEASSNTPLKLINLAKNNNYSKIFAKVPKHQSDIFFDAGFEEEARIPGFYDGKITALFMAFYLNVQRGEEREGGKMDEILKLALNKQHDNCRTHLNNDFTLRICKEQDAEVMANIYRKIFPSYPFPIYDSSYIVETMKSHVDYFGIEADGQLIAISSAEMDKQSSNAEMTDFATIPKWRGNGFGQFLLARMENEMKIKNIKTTYTIARAMSIGMNITFSKAGYEFGGRLKNNTNISGKIESMNVWHKKTIC